MFVIGAQPRVYCPNSKSRPFSYKVLIDEHITQFGSGAFFLMEFGGGGEADGLQVTFAGQLFTTDSSSTHTFNTFDASGAVDDVGANFAEMLRSNYHFQNYIIFTSSGGGVYTVQAFYLEFKEIDDWTFDVSALTMPNSLTESNGQPYKFKNMRLWYRFFNDVAPVSVERFADIPYLEDSGFFSVVEIDFMELLKGLVRTTRPLFHTIGPLIDNGYSELLHLKVGIIEVDGDCNQVFTKSIQSSKAIAVNSVHQLHETNEFKDHCLSYTSPIKFLSNRPTRMVICPGTHEWIHFWAEKFPTMAGAFRVIYSFYDSMLNTATPTAQTFLDIDEDREAIQIDIGPGNLYLLSVMPVGTVRYSIQVWAQEFDGVDDPIYQPYTEVLDRVLQSCNCKGAEIYYLEDRGSWRTLVFEKLLRRTITQDEDIYQRPIDFDGGVQESQIYVNGGRFSSANNVDQVFVLESAKFIDRERDMLEQLLRSPEVLIKTTSDAGVVTRRIILDRQPYDTFTNGTANRLQIPFRFNNKIISH